jgi:peroxiredoxin
VGYNFGVGRKAPDFALTSQDGDRVTLTQYRGDWFVAVVFYADGLAGAADNVTALSKAGTNLWGQRTQIVGVVRGDLDAAKALAGSAAEAAFPLLADEDGAVARAFGATDAAGTTRNYVALVDRAGKIVWIGDGRLQPVKLNEITEALRDIAR